MTTDQKLCYSEGTLWRNQCKGQCLHYADQVTREDPYALIPEDPPRSLLYHQNRVMVSQRCLSAPDQFAAQNSASLVMMMADPTTADELALLGAVINLWETLSGGIPPEPLSAATAQMSRTPESGTQAGPR
jgi:hypothetical protein